MDGEGAGGRDPEEEFELVRRMVERTEEYVDSLGELDEGFRGFDINYILEDVLADVEIPPVGVKHLSRRFGLPRDPYSYAVLVAAMHLMAAHHGVSTPGGGNGLYYSRKTGYYYLVAGSYDLEARRFSYVTVRLRREELAGWLREAMERFKRWPR